MQLNNWSCSGQPKTPHGLRHVRPLSRQRGSWPNSSGPSKKKLNELKKQQGPLNELNKQNEPQELSTPNERRSLQHIRPPSAQRKWQQPSKLKKRNERLRGLRKRLRNVPPHGRGNCLNNGRLNRPRFGQQS